MFVLVVAAAFLLVFLAIATLAERRHLSHPTILALAVTLLAAVALTYGGTRALLRVTGQSPTGLQAARLQFVALAALTIYLIGIATAFGLTHRQPLRTRVLLTSAVALPAVGIAVVVLLYASCWAGLGCI